MCPNPQYSLYENVHISNIFLTLIAHGEHRFQGSTACSCPVFGAVINFDGIVTAFVVVVTVAVEVVTVVVVVVVVMVIVVIGVAIIAVVVAIIVVVAVFVVAVLGVVIIVVVTVVVAVVVGTRNTSSNKIIRTRKGYGVTRVKSTAAPQRTREVP